MVTSKVTTKIVEREKFKQGDIVKSKWNIVLVSEVQSEGSNFSGMVIHSTSDAAYQIGHYSEEWDSVLFVKEEIEIVLSQKL